MSGYIYHQGWKGGKPIKAWTNGVEIEYAALQQLQNIGQLPIVFKHVAAMPDVHFGIGTTVGSVIATKGAIIPAAVGVDIGCGMMAYQLSLKADQLPDNLSAIRADIERAVPHGNAREGSWGNVSDSIANRWKTLEARYTGVIDKHPGAASASAYCQLGTLGGGNHFIEICLDQNNDVWVMLHSGSRGLGNRIGRYFIAAAKEEMNKYYITPMLPDKDLAYLVEHTVIFDDYVNALTVAQDYAAENRKVMMGRILNVLHASLPPFQVMEHAINCHHNYMAREHHFGENVLVTRKGAVRACEGDLGIIPGSMGTGSFIVRGKGNAESFCSCSHGAGRKLSRSQAKKEISLEQHIAATSGIECRKDIAVLDESPAAYKDVNAVIAAQSDLIEVLFTLRQVINVKG